MQYGTFRKYLSIGILIFSLLVSGVIIFDIIKSINKYEQKIKSKWCKKYNLPFRTYDIKNIFEQDLNKI